MFDGIKQLIALLTDKTKSFGYKFITFMAFVGLVFLLDFIFSLTYNLHLNNKLEQLDKINLLKKEYKLDTTKLNKLKTLENEVFYKEHYYQFISRNIQNVPKLINNKNSEIQNLNISEINPKRSLYWMAFSSNWLIILIIPVILIVPFFDQMETTEGELILGVFALLVIIGIFIAITTWIAFKIPLLNGKPYFNYIINFVINSIFWIFIMKSGKKKN